MTVVAFSQSGFAAIEPSCDMKGLHNDENVSANQLVIGPLITQKTQEALAKRKEIRPIKIEYPATIRWDYLSKGSPRTHSPAFKPFGNPRRVEKTGDSVEALLIGK